MANGKIETYPEVARSIAVWLDEWLDRSLPYPAMIAEAARRSSKEVDRLRRLLNNKIAAEAPPCNECAEAASWNGVNYCPNCGRPMPR